MGAFGLGTDATIGGLIVGFQELTMQGVELRGWLVVPCQYAVKMESLFDCDEK